MTAFALCTRRHRLAALAAACCLAAAAAPIAGADPSLAPPLPAVTGTAGIAAAVEAAIPAVVEIELPAAEEPPPPTEPVSEPEPPTPPAPEPVAAAPEGDAALPPVEAVAEPIAELPEQKPVAAAAQQQPVNVNVSIRVDSPGDDGAVTQTNAVVAVTTAPVAQTPVPDARYQEQVPQYQPPAEIESTPEPTQAPTPQSAPSVPATWTWNWDCADGLPPTFGLPSGSLSEKWIWNWTGNCGGIVTGSQNGAPQSAPQYQPGVTQYQPVNVNVSIRIASPGSNGPVVQANVAVAVAVAPPPLVVVPVSPPPAPADAAPASPAVDLWIQPAAVVELPAEGAQCTSALPFGEPACVIPADPLPVETPPAASGPTARAVSTSAERELAAAGTAGARLELTARLVATLAPPRPALEAAARSRVPERRGRHAPALPDLTRQPVAALGLVAPARGGLDLSPFLTFVFLAAFVFAFADAAWRMRDGGWQPTAAEPGRRRERPG